MTDEPRVPQGPEMRCYHSDAEHPLREFDDLRYAETYILREEALSEKARRQLQA